jgi:hypothetical protein
MKIDRLYTLSQFVDRISSTYKLKGDDIEDRHRFRFVSKYNDFLKQPLNKEMFINELEKPYEDDEKYQTIWLPDIEDYDTDYIPYNKDLKAWQEAEKKVIFEFPETNKDNVIYEMPYYYEGLRMETLLDLANKSNGQLKTKNLEI